MSYQPPSPQELADRGSQIYERKYRSEFEPKWKGRYAAIDIDSERAFVEDFPEEAIARARKELPGKLFYLIRIGSRGAFRIGRRTAVNASSRHI
jgi:hypothetical protein